MSRQSVRSQLQRELLRARVKARVRPAPGTSTGAPPATPWPSRSGNKPPTPKVSKTSG